MIRNRAVLSVALAALVLLVIVPVAGAQTAITPVVQVPLSPSKIPQFIDPLPVLGAGIPIVDGGALSQAPGTEPVPIDIRICEFQTDVLPTGTFLRNQKPQTWVWGYQVGDGPCVESPSHSYIGPVVLARKGTPTEVSYFNQLPDTAVTNVLAYQQAVDQTLMWADPGNGATNPFFTLPNGGGSEKNECRTTPQPAWCVDPTNFYNGPVPAAPHLHGGEIPAMLDGGPDAWWTGNGLYGHGYYSKGGFGDAAGGKAVYTYPNGQDAAPIWFHDHTLGATRLNVYAGIAGAYMIVDPELQLPTGLTALGLENGKPTAPGGPATQELLVPVVIQDRMFDVNGQLLFPNLGINPEHPFWIPEFVGDTIVVNGKAWPFHNVEPKRYRFLFLNGSNARAYELFLINKATGVKGPVMWVIGTDQGYLDAPVKIDPNLKPNDKLIIMPGERYEVIIDFGGLPNGTKFLLANTAKTPYPDGGPVSGRTTGRIMEFRVGACGSGFCGTNDKSYNPASLGPNGQPVPVRPDPMVRLADPLTGTQLTPTVHKVRRLTLNEAMGPGGPLEVLVNNTSYVGDARAIINGTCDRSASPDAPFNCGDFKAITTQWNTTFYSELPHEGETELWEIVNLTADAHPIHPHLVAFQLMNREAFNLKGYDATYNGAFPAIPGDPVYIGGVYIPGFGPPLNYNSSGVVNCPMTPPGRGPEPCVLGGNPDPTPFLSGVKIPPLPSEAGWKDTVIAYPGQVTRFLVRFAPTPLPNNTDANAREAAYHFNPNGGHGYVWHCHIIDHEDNEMMRPFSVFANPYAPYRDFVMGPDF